MSRRVKSRSAPRARSMSPATLRSIERLLDGLSGGQRDSVDNEGAGVVSMMHIAGPRSLGVGGLVAAGVLALPIPLPSPGLPSVPVPSPSLPAVVATVSPPALSTPTGLPRAKVSPPAQATGAGASPPAGAATPQPKPVTTQLPVRIPFTTISVSSP